MAIEMAARPARSDFQKASALHLHYRQKYGVRHTARILGLPSSTVHDWVRRGAGTIQNPRLRQVAAVAQAAHEANDPLAIRDSFGELALAIIEGDLELAEQVFPGGDEVEEPVLTFDWTKFDAARKAMHLAGENYEGEFGNRDHITRSEEGTIPTDFVKNLQGARGEVPGGHRNRQGQKWTDFVNDVKTNGVKNPIFITVDQGEQPKISEGNHRRDAAVEAGLDNVPVEIKYYGHAEQEGTVAERAQGLAAAEPLRFAWDEALHPRGFGGKWIHLGDVEQFAAGDQVRVNRPGDAAHHVEGRVAGQTALGSMVEVDLANGESGRAFYPDELEKATKAKEITAADLAGRGNSRAVTSDEFQQIAAKGRAQMEQREKNASPPSGLDQNWETIQRSSYQAAQEPWGGATIDAHTGETQSGESGYALTARPPGVDTISVPEGASQAEFNAAMDQARQTYADQLAIEGMNLGVFHDDALNRIDIDPVLMLDSLDQVESIGAYTNATGGAYNFADGNGYWPPHVSSATDAQQATAAIAAAEGARAGRGSSGVQAADAPPGPAEPPADEAEPEPVEPDAPPPPRFFDQLSAEAWHRFLNLISNDVPAYRAVRACRVIDPDFSPSADTINRAYGAIGKSPGEAVRMGENWTDEYDDVLLLANWSAGHVAPPQYVLNMYDEFEMGAVDIADLSLRLRQMAEESYLEGINSQLSALGLDPVLGITDPQTLYAMEVDAQKTAETIAGTYNKDLGGAVYEAWIDGLATRGRQMSAYHLDNSVSQWAEHRIGWKTNQIADTETTKWYNRAVQQFAERNYGVLPDVKFYVTPDQCKCAACKALVDGNPYELHEVTAINLPLHINCVHSIIPVYSGEADTYRALWAGQDYDAGEIIASEDDLGNGIFAPPRVVLEMAGVTARRVAHGRHRGGGSAQTLRDYWSNVPTKHGKVGGILWGIGGDFYECVARVSKFMNPEQAKGYCALRHHQATGAWPGHAPAELAAKAAGKSLTKADKQAALKRAAQHHSEELPLPPLADEPPLNFFDPGQLRWPKGTPVVGGQWVAGGITKLVTEARGKTGKPQAKFNRGKAPNADTIWGAGSANLKKGQEAVPRVTADGIENMPGDQSAEAMKARMATLLERANTRQRIASAYQGLVADGQPHGKSDVAKKLGMSEAELDGHLAAIHTAPAPTKRNQSPWAAFVDPKGGNAAGMDIEKDKAWYPIAHQIIGEHAAKFGVDPTLYAGVVAACSTHMAWEGVGKGIGNIEAADRVVKAALDHPDWTPEQIATGPSEWKKTGLGFMSAPIEKGVRILRGGPDSIGQELTANTSPKTTNFFNNLVWPNDPNAGVTIDRHMAQALLGTHAAAAKEAAGNLVNGTPGTGAEAGAGYGWTANVFSQAAQAAGMDSQQFQALIWEEWRKEGGSSAKTAAGAAFAEL